MTFGLIIQIVIYSVATYVLYNEIRDLTFYFKNKFDFNIDNPDYPKSPYNGDTDALASNKFRVLVGNPLFIVGWYFAGYLSGGL